MSPSNVVIPANSGCLRVCDQERRGFSGQKQGFGGCYQKLGIKRKLVSASNVVIPANSGCLRVCDQERRGTLA